MIAVKAIARASWHVALHCSTMPKRRKLTQDIARKRNKPNEEQETEGEIIMH